VTEKTDAEPRRDIVVEEILPHPPERVWTALTTSDLIARWLMPNDFRCVVGATFTFETRPIGSWNGVVHCEVLEVVPFSRLVYRWAGGTDNDPTYGDALDTVVTWTLTPVEGGTRLRLVHAGFRSPGNDFAFGAMEPGWQRIVTGIAKVLVGAD
jgi:uncharacterized protein YndB with AHSA1/START domain